MGFTFARASGSRGTVGRTTALTVLAVTLSASVQRKNEFPETLFSRPPAPTVAMVKGRPVPLSPAYDGLIARSTLQTGEELYLVAESVLSDGDSIAHLIVVAPYLGGARAVATTHLLGQPIELGSVIREHAGEFVIAGPTRSFRRYRMHWVSHGPDSGAVKRPAPGSEDAPSATFADERGILWTVGKPVGAVADSVSEEMIHWPLIGFNDVASEKSYLPPKPTMELFRRLRPEEFARNGRPDVVRANVSSVARVGQKAWFGVMFYDSEGMSGVGGVGAFDLSTRTFDMRWGAGDANASIGKIEVFLDDVWVSLVDGAEYGTYPVGAAHYSISRNKSTRLDVPGDIHAIVRMSQSIGTIFATTDGLFRVVGTNVIPLPIEWDRQGTAAPQPR